MVQSSALDNYLQQALHPPGPICWTARARWAAAATKWGAAKAAPSASTPAMSSGCDSDCTVVPGSAAADWGLAAGSPLPSLVYMFARVLFRRVACKKSR